jgi:hypothetical protein
MNWGNRPDGLSDASKCASAKQLFSLIVTSTGMRDGRPPYLLDTVSPFLIAREIGLSSRDQQARPTEQYRFQFGPRRWSSGIYPWDNSYAEARLPAYERRTLAIARELKAGDWVTLAQKMFETTFKAGIFGKYAGSDEPIIQIVLCWQGADRICSIRDQRSGRAVAYGIGKDGFEFLGVPDRGPLERLQQRAYGSPAPIMPSASGEEASVARRIRPIEDLRAEIMWHYSSKLDRSFDNLMLEAVDRLKELGSVVAVAHSRSRFNDAAGDENWIAVRVDNSAWENGTYFQSSTASLRGAPSVIHEAVGILHHLIACGMDRIFSNAYGNSVTPGDVTGVFIDGNGAFFACCDTNCVSGPVYLIDPRTGATSLYGFTSLFDDSFNSGSRAGGTIPAEVMLDILSIDEVLKRVETGKCPNDAPPHDLDIAWRNYLPAGSEA